MTSKTNEKDAYCGLKGRLIILAMQLSHNRIQKELVSKMRIQSNDNLLDIGCGSGGLIKKMAAQTKGFVLGVDQSDSMVKAAMIKNAKKISEKQVNVIRAAVSHLPIEDGEIDEAVAFETIQFWSDIVNDLKEVKRTLSKDGKLFIANRMPKPRSKWYDWVKIKSKEAYKEVLSHAGFKQIEMYMVRNEKWIFIMAA